MRIVHTTYLFYITLGFSFIILILIVAITIMMLWKRNALAKYKKISAHFTNWLTEIVLEENGNNVPSSFAVPDHIVQLLKKKTGRQVLLNELIMLKKNLNGSAGSNLERLYNQLQLEELSLHKLHSKHWHMKGKGMQELAIMNQRQQLRAIYKYINHPHPYLRMEAQAALVRYNGFKGLRFLNRTEYPLTEWQHLGLLQLLLYQPVTADMPVEKLLSSANTSAVQFALRLITEQHDASYYEMVAGCLRNADDKVKKLAIYCLGEIAVASTPSLLISEYRNYHKNIQLAVLQVLQKTGTAAELDFLHRQLLSADADIRLACIKAIHAIKSNLNDKNIIHPEAEQFLQTA